MVIANGKYLFPDANLAKVGVAISQAQTMIDADIVTIPDSNPNPTSKAC